jgi:hypothetical protein
MTLNTDLFGKVQAPYITDYCIIQDHSIREKRVKTHFSLVVKQIKEKQQENSALISLHPTKASSAETHSTYQSLSP